MISSSARSQQIAISAQRTKVPVRRFVRRPVLAEFQNSLYLDVEIGEQLSGPR
jgi:hypothetical protein